jgi:ELWxxDGT repeat protein
LKDIAPGAASSNSGFGILGPLGARAFFIADDGTGRDIWATDGQPGGTEKVTRFGDVDWPVVTWQEHLLVAVRGDELWATDGTEAGTRRILDSEPVTMESFQVCDSGATLAFVGTVGQAHGLWIADDLLGGTPTRLDLPSSLCVDIPFLTCEAGMWLAAVDGELWRADPDTLELSRIADVNQRLTESFFADFSAGNANPSDWATRRTIHGDLAYFTRAAPICCAEGYDSFGPLWVTDGTSDGTRQVWPDPGEPCEQQIPLRIVATAGSRVFFEGSQGLWVSDGTPDSTHLLVNTTFGEYVLSPLGRLFALGGWPSIILWSTDGTPEGSGAVREWSQGDIDIDLIASLGERVVFTTRASDQKLQLWISDGTEAGTRVLAQLGDGHSVTAIGQTDAGYFFGAEDSRSRLLWVTDGTEAGTRLVRTWPSRLLNWWGHELPFLYLKYEDRWQLWQIVGQDVQLVTERAGNIASVRVPLKRIGDRLVFLETNAEQRTALWVTDGTEAGTHRLLETEDAIELFGTANDLVWFWRAGELWATDGTPGGTRLEHAFADVRTDPAYSRWPELTKSEITGAPAGQGGEHGTTPYPVIWPKKGLVLFSGDDGVHGYEPWALRLSSRDAPRFLRADSNADATVDISDPVRTLERLFLDGSAPACRAASDANADGLLDISDAVYTLAYLFLGGAAPSAPFPGCGPGGLPADPLDCASPPAGCP